MDFQRLAEEVRSQVRERPYWTTAAFFGVGWIIGRTLPLRAVLAVAGIGARAAMAAALEHAVIERVRPRDAQTDESPPQVVTHEQSGERAAGTAKGACKVEKNVGKLVGSERLEAKGRARELAGRDSAQVA